MIGGQNLIETPEEISNKLQMALSITQWAERNPSQPKIAPVSVKKTIPPKQPTQ